MDKMEILLVLFSFSMHLKDGNIKLSFRAIIRSFLILILTLKKGKHTTNSSLANTVGSSSSMSLKRGAYIWNINTLSLKDLKYSALLTRHIIADPPFKFLLFNLKLIGIPSHQTLTF